MPTLEELVNEIKADKSLSGTALAVKPVETAKPKALPLSALVESIKADPALTQPDPRDAQRADLQRAGALGPHRPALSNPTLRTAFDQLTKRAREELGLEVRITSGDRSSAKQAQLYANRHKNPYPVAPPGRSQHEHGRAVDLNVYRNGKKADQREVAKLAQELGLRWLGAKDRVHFELAGDPKGAAPAGKPGKFDIFEAAADALEIPKRPAGKPGKPAPKPTAKPTGTIRSRLGSLPLELPDTPVGQALNLANQALNVNPLTGLPLKAVTNFAGQFARKETTAVENKWAAEDAAKAKQAEAERRERLRRTVGTLDPLTLAPVTKPKPQNLLQKTGGVVQGFINQQPIIGGFTGYSGEVSDALYAAQKAGAAPANVKFAPPKSPQGQAEQASVARLKPLLDAYQEQLNAQHTAASLAGQLSRAEPTGALDEDWGRPYVEAGKAWNWQDFGAFLKSQGIQKLTPWEQKLLNTSITAKKIEWAQRAIRDNRVWNEYAQTIIGEIVGQSTAPFVVAALRVPAVKNGLLRAALPNQANVGNAIANTYQEGAAAARQEGATPQSIATAAAQGGATGYGATAALGGLGAGVQAVRGAKARGKLAREAQRLEGELAASNPLTQPRAQAGTTAAQVAEAQGKLAALEGGASKPALPQAPAARAPRVEPEPLPVEVGTRTLEQPKPSVFKSGDVVTVLKPDGTPRPKPGTVARRNADGSYVLSGEKAAVPAERVQPVAEAPLPTAVPEQLQTAPTVESKAPAPLPGEVRVTPDGGLAVKGKRPYTAEETDDILRLHEAMNAEDWDVRQSALAKEIGPERLSQAAERMERLQSAGRLEPAVKAHSEWRAAEEAWRLDEVDKLRVKTEQEALGQAEEVASAVSMRDTGKAKNRKTGRTVNYTNIERVPVAERQRLLDAALKKNPARGEYVYEGGAAGKGATVRDLVLEQGILPDDLGMRSRSSAAKPQVTSRTLPMGEVLDKVPTRREVAATQKAAAKSEFEAALKGYQPPAKLFSGVTPDPEFVKAVAAVVPVARAAVKYGHASAKELVEVLREAVGNHSDAFFKSVIDQLKKEDGDFEAPASAAPEPKPIADGKKSTGLANQVQERELLEGIIKAPEKGIPQSARTFQQRGKSLVDEGKADPEALAREIATGKKGITADDFGVLLEGDRRLKNAVNAARGKLDAAIKSGDDASFLRTQYEAAVAKRQAYLDDVQKGKTEWHNIGMALQAGADLNTGDFAEVIAEAARAKGAPLSRQSEEVFRKLTDDYNAAVSRADQLEATLLAERARSAKAQAEPSGGITEAPDKPKRLARRERILTERKAIEDQIDQILRDVARVNDLGGVVYESGRFAMAAGKLLLNHLDEAALGTEEAIAKVIATFKAKGVELSRADLVREVAELTEPEQRTKSELQATKGKIIAELRREEALTREIEALKRGEKTERNPTKQKQKSARISELEAERAGLLQDAKPKADPKQSAEPKPKLTPEQRQAARDARSIANAKAKTDLLNAGGTLPKKPKAQPSPEVAKAQGELNRARRRADARARLSELEEQLRSGQFRTVTPKEKLLEKQLADTRAKADLLRTEIRGRIGQEKPKTLGQQALNALQVPKSLLSSLDISAGGRQGWLVGVANPDLAAKAFSAQMKAFSNPVAAQKLQNSILNRPNAAKYKQAGLYLSPLGSHSEEAFQGKLFQNWKRLNPIEASERAYSAYLNSIRADTFDRMVRSSGNTSPEALKAIANYVNVATGRGGGPELAKAASLLNNFMFSPRFVASRFQYAGLTPLITGKGARWAIAKQYARTLLGLGSVIALAELAGADVEKDPRSSDFLKLRFGNTRTDMLGGIQQGIVLAARLYTKETKGVDAPGKVGQVKKNQPGNVLARFARSKASPVAGVAWTLMEEKNFVGEEYQRNDPKTYGKVAVDLVAPLTAKELVEAAVKDGVEPQDALMLLNVLGFSTARYDDDQKAKPRPN